MDPAPDHFEKWWQSLTTTSDLPDVLLLRQAFDEGVLFERNRCSQIVSDARFGKRDGDLRSLIHAMRNP